MTGILPSHEYKRTYVRQMFGRIAPYYDVMNRIMTFGLDQIWRKKVVNLLHPVNYKQYLDLGAGTGDLAREIRSTAPQATIIAADLTMEMMRYGKDHHKSTGIQWVVADAQALPFSSGIFDGIVSGYLIRNVPDIDATLSEQRRVLKDQAMMICLDTTPPGYSIFYPFIMIYLKWIIPLVGRLVSGDAHAYQYLPESTQKHVTANSLAEQMRQTGYHSVGFEKFQFGTMAVHWGKK